MAEIEFGKSGRIKQFNSHLKGLSSADILDAVNAFEEAGFQADSYEPSTHYDLLIDNKPYPPKAIFGLAASKYLGFEVKSNHFVGGEDSVSFRKLAELGFEVSPKTERPGPDEGLNLHALYSRKDVCSIFSPETSFKAGTGSWGISEIISNAPCINDFVFFVTLGVHDGNDYEDAITEDGVLIWKSQNQHSPDSKVIQSLLSHDEDRNNIYLFLRTSEKDDYRYFGPITFRDWDPMSSNPVHFTWDILSWPLPADVHESLSGVLLPALSPTYSSPVKPASKQVLVESEKPKPRKKISQPSKRDRAPIDWAEREQRNRKLGLAGEKLVLEYEKQKLIEAGCEDLAEKVLHIAEVNSAAGYDIESFCLDTFEKIYIEVKTTTGGASTPFYISQNEVNVSEFLGDSYRVYRVYGYSADTDVLKFFCANGSVEYNFQLECQTFKALPKL